MQDKQGGTVAGKGKSGGAIGRRLPDAQVMLRISTVYQLISRGNKTPDIRRAVAFAASQEKQQRDRATEEGKPHLIPPRVWGDTAPPKRTLDYYIHTAKKQLEEEGRSLGKQGNLIMGTQMARINDLYAVAFAAKDYSTCARLIEETNSMFGLKGVVRLHITQEAIPGEEDELPESDFTDAQLLEEAYDLTRLIADRKRQKLLNAAPGEVVERREA